MKQVLLRIPIPGTGLEIPVFGYGLFVFLGFLAALWLARRRAPRFGINPDQLFDLGLAMLLAGIVGGRLMFVWMFRDEIDSWWEVFAIWEGGLVLYGAVAGGVLAFLLYCRRHGLSTVRLLDLLAPAVALGVGIGRIGCFLNGCCWGDPTMLPWAVEFPYASPPHWHHVRQGLVSPGLWLANTKDGVRVLDIQPGSWASDLGLQIGDTIRSVDTGSGRKAVRHSSDVYGSLRELSPGEEVRFEVFRSGTSTSLRGVFAPKPPGSLPVHPTQLYSAVGASLIALWLHLSRPEAFRPGMAVALLMIAYGSHRFLIEVLRDDLPAVAWKLTLAQWISVVLVVAGLAWALVLWFTASRRGQPESVSEGD